MRAYQTIRFAEYPDVGDIQAEGRKSSVGRLDDKAYIRGRKRKAVRRYLKRSDKARVALRGWDND